MQAIGGALTVEEQQVAKRLLMDGWRNQDIQALVNHGRRATINSARITAVKKNNEILPATDQQLVRFKASKKSYDPKTGLNLFHDERVIRARESMMLAVNVFNNSMVLFKSEVFSVLANIAWTYLLHDYYIKKGISIVDDNGYTFSLSYMIDRNDCPLSKGIINNLKSLKIIRDEVEHRILGPLMHKWFSLFQACCLNFDKTLVSMCGEDCSLADHLSLALQFAKLDIDQIATAQAFDLGGHLEAIDARLKKDLSQDELDDVEYQFRVVYTIDAGSKSDSHFVFVKPGTPEAENVKHVLVKTQFADNAYPYKPGAATAAIRKKAGIPFTGNDHIKAWKHYKARPSRKSKKLDETRKEFCIYHKAHNDWTYSQQWIDFVADKIASPAELAAIRAEKL